MDSLKALLTTTAVNVTIICTAIIILAVVVIWWAESSSKDVTVWGIEVRIHESDQVRACRIIQSNTHDQLASLEGERQAQIRHRRETAFPLTSK
jgi:hypothetical protein